MSISTLEQKDREQVVTDRRFVDHRQATTATPRVVPDVTVRTHYIQRRAAKPSAWPVVSLHAFAFVLVAGLTYVMSSVAGQVMVERARKDVTDAQTRTIEARKAEEVIRNRVDLLTRADRTEEWALAHGMVPVDGLGQLALVTSHGTKSE